MSRAAAYLTLPIDYISELGWRWSYNCDAIEDERGRTIILVDQLLLILDGVFAAPGPPPPLAFVLHLFALSSATEWPWVRVSERFRPLRNACTKAKPSPRNLGLLFAELCQGLPPFVDPPMWRDLFALLMDRQLTRERHRPELLQVAALTSTAFLQSIAQQLADYDEAYLTHWLKHGSGPNTDGKKLADAVQQLPQRVGGGLLEVLRQRERLVGAATLVPALDAALTLPPRQPRPDRLPEGGYADVTTRGDPDRLLPSQFALDPDEFIRRFANRELLYFRREEPHRPTAPERCLVLDQGMRTWGLVRLGLTAGVVALLGKDPHKYGSPKLCLTSHAELLDPAEMPTDALADRLEASDLSASPSDALALVFAEPSTVNDPPRDVLLFTHPRNLKEGDVRASVRLRRPNDRLFTLTVDDDGHAELGEWTSGGHVPIRSFRVDLTAAEAAKVTRPTKTKPIVAVGEWTGDIEPVPFPFRAGLVTDVERIGFDAAGEWVVVIGRDGAIQAQKPFTGESVEVLPRPYRDGVLFKDVEEILGVTGGVVLCDRRLVDEQSGCVLNLAHYDFTQRTVKLHRLGPVSERYTLLAFPDLHSVAARYTDQILSQVTSVAIDLAASPLQRSDRAELARLRAISELPSPLALPVITTPPVGPYLTIADDELHLHRWPRTWATIRPVANGQPLVRGQSPQQAILAGDVLGVVLKAATGPTNLYLVRGPDSTVLGEHRITSHSHAFALNRTGSRLARQTGGRSAEVRETTPGGAVSASMYSGRYHTRVEMRLFPDQLQIRIGSIKHVLTLQPGFQHSCNTVDTSLPTSQHLTVGTRGTAIAYDPERFLDPITAGPWLAAFDRWGQIVLMTLPGRVVLTVLVRREQIGVWLPDGTRWGAGPLLGGPGHPLAIDRISAALRAAVEDGK